MDGPPKLSPGYTDLMDLLESKDIFNGLKKIGKDFHGAEWLVRHYIHPKNGMHVAYKQLMNTPTYDSFKQLIREIDITNRVRHPCTMQLVSFDLSNLEKPIIVDKFYEKGSLDNFFGKTFIDSKYREWGNMTLNPSDGNEMESKIEIEKGTVYTIFMYGIARGIKYLHKLKVFHRDLKPANIVIDEFYRPYIADFGFSKISENSRNSAKLGSPLYMAPEILQDGCNRYSFPADIFALGLIFYSLTECKACTVNINKKLRPDQILKKIYQDYSNGNMPELRPTNKFSGLIQRMWSVNPEQRPKIDEICKILEEEDYWFENTDREAFLAYKKEIDEFEEQQLPLVLDVKAQSADDATDLNQQLKKIIQKKKRQNKNVQDANNDLVQPNTAYRMQQIYLENASNNNYEAECALGSIFYTGHLGIPKDYKTAWKYFENAKKHGNSQGDIYMMSILKEIIENEPDIKSAEPIFNDEDDRLKNLKNMKSQLLYGMVKEAKEQYSEALSLYTKSASQGSIEAKGRIGSLLLLENSMLDKAEKYLLEASQWKSETKSINIDENERIIALVNLGILKKNQNDDEAIEIFSYLLDFGHPDAALHIATIYEKKGDIEKVKEYCKIASEKFGNISAQDYLDQFKEKK